MDRENILTDKDKQKINLIKKIQRIAREDRTQIDKTNHQNNKNLDLLNFIDSCGIDSSVFVKEYLAQVQPFMIYKVNEKSNDHFWFLLDSSYSIPLWVEICSVQFQEYIISFHEMNWEDKPFIKKTESEILLKSNTIQTLPVNTFAPFEVDIVKGIEVFTLNLVGKYLGEDYFRVDYKVYEEALLSICKNRIKDLFQNESIQINHLNQYRFTSWGTTMQNKLSFILDCMINNSDLIQEASIILAVYIQELLTRSDGEVILSILEEKYKTFLNNYNIPALLNQAKKIYIPEGRKDELMQLPYSTTP